MHFAEFIPQLHLGLQLHLRSCLYIFIIELKCSFGLHAQVYIAVIIQKISSVLTLFVYPSPCFSSASWSLWVWGQCLQPPPVPHRKEAQSHCRCVSATVIADLRVNQLDLTFLILHVKKHWKLDKNVFSYPVCQVVSPSSSPKKQHTTDTTPVLNPFVLEFLPQVIKWHVPGGDRTGPEAVYTWLQVQRQISEEKKT